MVEAAGVEVWREGRKSLWSSTPCRPFANFGSAASRLLQLRSAGSRGLCQSRGNESAERDARGRPTASSRAHRSRPASHSRAAKAAAVRASGRDACIPLQLVEDVFLDLCVGFLSLHDVLLTTSTYQSRSRSSKLCTTRQQTARQHSKAAEHSLHERMARLSRTRAKCARPMIGASEIERAQART